MALTKDRDTRQRTGDRYSRPVKGATTIYAGALVCLTAAGFAVPGSADATLIADGRARSQVVNAGVDGAESVDVEPGVFRFDSGTSADAITAANIGDTVYVIDDHTVGATSAPSGGNPTRPVAGKVVDVDAGGVWVAVGISRT